jgi:hypothetical protein
VILTCWVILSRSDLNPKEITGNDIDDDGGGSRDDVHGINAKQNTGDTMTKVGRHVRQ